MKENKNLFIIVGVLLVLLLGIGGYFVFGNRTEKEDTEQTQNLDEVITLSPDAIDLEMVTRNNNKEIKFIAHKLENAKTLEWEFNYDADIPPQYKTEDGPEKVTQNFGSSEPVNVEGKSSFESPFREIGTCSSGKCRFDTGVEKVNLVIKMTKTDGKEYQIEDSLDLTK